MTTPFLTYEMLTPETADPVVIRITGQKERGFPDFTASNGVWVASWTTPEYYPSGNPSPVLVVWGGEENGQEAFAIRIPLADWPAVKQAIGELNAAKRGVPKGTYKKARGVFAGNCPNELPEETMKRLGGDMKEDRYEFPLNEWDYECKTATRGTWEGMETVPLKVILTRKKPKVKVEYHTLNNPRGSIWGVLGEARHKAYYLVQFRVMGDVEEIAAEGFKDLNIRMKPHMPTTVYYHFDVRASDLYICKDAHSQWSCPVLLPESIFSRLDEICKALEDRANGGKG